MDMRKIMNLCESKTSTKRIIKESGEVSDRYQKAVEILSTLEGSNIDGWELWSMHDLSGSFMIWTKDGIDTYATPFWDNENGIVVQITKESVNDVEVIPYSLSGNDEKDKQTYLNKMETYFSKDESLEEDVDMFGHDDAGNTSRRIDITKQVQQNPKLTTMDPKELAKQTGNYTEGFDYALESIWTFKETYWDNVEEEDPQQLVVSGKSYDDVVSKVVNKVKKMADSEIYYGETIEFDDTDEMSSLESIKQSVEVNGVNTFNLIERTSEVQESLNEEYSEVSHKWFGEQLDPIVKQVSEQINSSAKNVPDDVYKENRYVAQGLLEELIKRLEELV